MKVEGEGKRVTVMLGEADRHDGKPLYESIVEMLRAEGCAGATVLRGIMGFGATSAIHRASFLDLSQDLPIVIVFTDTAERVDRVVPKVDALLVAGTVIVEDVHVVTYRPRS